LPLINTIGRRFEAMDNLKDANAKLILMQEEKYKNFAKEKEF
jgi:hypothetical protein